MSLTLENVLPLETFEKSTFYDLMKEMMETISPNEDEWEKLLSSPVKVEDGVNMKQNWLKTTIPEVAFVVSLLAKSAQSETFLKYFLDEWKEANKNFKHGQWLNGPKCIGDLWYQSQFNIRYKDQKECDKIPALCDINTMKGVRKLFENIEKENDENKKNKKEFKVHKSTLKVDWTKDDSLAKQDFENTVMSEGLERKYKKGFESKFDEKSVHVSFIGQSFFSPIVICDPRYKETKVSLVSGPRVNHRAIDSKDYLMSNRGKESMVEYLLNPGVDGMTDFDTGLYVSVPYKITTEKPDKMKGVAKESKSLFTSQINGGQDEKIKHIGLYATDITEDDVNECYETVTGVSFSDVFDVKGKNVRQKALMMFKVLFEEFERKFESLKTVRGLVNLFGILLKRNLKNEAILNEFVKSDMFKPKSIHHLYWMINILFLSKHSVRTSMIEGQKRNAAVRLASCGLKGNETGLHSLTKDEFQKVQFGTTDRFAERLGSDVNCKFIMLRCRDQQSFLEEHFEFLNAYSALISAIVKNAQTTSWSQFLSQVLSLDVMRFVLEPIDRNWKFRDDFEKIQERYSGFLPPQDKKEFGPSKCYPIRFGKYYALGENWKYEFILTEIYNIMSKNKWFETAIESSPWAFKHAILKEETFGRQVLKVCTAKGWDLSSLPIKKNGSYQKPLTLFCLTRLTCLVGTASEIGADFKPNEGLKLLSETIGISYKKDFMKHFQEQLYNICPDKVDYDDVQSNFFPLDGKGEDHNIGLFLHNAFFPGIQLITNQIFQEILEHHEEECANKKKEKEEEAARSGNQVKIPNDKPLQKKVFYDKIEQVVAKEVVQVYHRLGFHVPYAHSMKLASGSPSLHKVLSSVYEDEFLKNEMISRQREKNDDYSKHEIVYTNIPVLLSVFAYLLRDGFFKVDITHLYKWTHHENGYTLVQKFLANEIPEDEWKLLKHVSSDYLEKDSTNILSYPTKLSIEKHIHKLRNDELFRFEMEIPSLKPDHKFTLSECLLLMTFDRKNKLEKIDSNLVTMAQPSGYNQEEYRYWKKIETYLSDLKLSNCAFFIDALNKGKFVDEKKKDEPSTQIDKGKYRNDTRLNAKEKKHLALAKDREDLKKRAAEIFENDVRNLMIKGMGLAHLVNYELFTKPAPPNKTVFTDTNIQEAIKNVGLKKPSKPLDLGEAPKHPMYDQGILGVSKFAERKFLQMSKLHQNFKWGAEVEVGDRQQLYGYILFRDIISNHGIKNIPTDGVTKLLNMDKLQQPQYYALFQDFVRNIDIAENCDRRYKRKFAATIGQWSNKFPQDAQVFETMKEIRKPLLRDVLGDKLNEVIRLDEKEQKKIVEMSSTTNESMDKKRAADETTELVEEGEAKRLKTVQGKDIDSTLGNLSKIFQFAGKSLLPNTNTIPGKNLIPAQEMEIDLSFSKDSQESKDDKEVMSTETPDVTENNNSFSKDNESKDDGSDKDDAEEKQEEGNESADLENLTNIDPSGGNTDTEKEEESEDDSEEPLKQPDNISDVEEQFRSYVRHVYKKTTNALDISGKAITKTKCVVTGNNDDTVKKLRSIFNKELGHTGSSFWPIMKVKARIWSIGCRITSTSTTTFQDIMLPYCTEVNSSFDYEAFAELLIAKGFLKNRMLKDAEPEFAMLCTLLKHHSIKTIQGRKEEEQIIYQKMEGTETIIEHAHFTPIFCHSQFEDITHSVPDIEKDNFICCKTCKFQFCSQCFENDHWSPQFMSELICNKCKTKKQSTQQPQRTPRSDKK